MTEAERRAVRKDQLIREGQLCRVGLLRAKMQLADNLRPQRLLHGATRHLAEFAAARAEQVLAPGGLRLQTAIPFLMTAGSFLARRKLLKPALGVGVAVAAVAAWVVRCRSAR